MRKISNIGFLVAVFGWTMGSAICYMMERFVFNEVTWAPLTMLIGGYGAMMVIYLSSKKIGD